MALILFLNIQGATQLRGTLSWAPPRPQIVLTVQNKPKNIKASAPVAATTELMVKRSREVGGGGELLDAEELQYCMLLDWDPRWRCLARSSVSDPHKFSCGSGSGSRIPKMSIWIRIQGGKH